MSSSICLDLEDFARATPRNEGAPSLRLTLLYGEAFRLPRPSRRLHVVAGSAWVSADGKDYIVGRGESFQIPRSSYCAVISATGGEALFFEVA